MIKAVRSDQECFNTVYFKPGLNIVLGKSINATDDELDEDRKKSLNGVGKSTLIEIINFCLASEFKPKESKEQKKEDKESEKILAQKELWGWTFILDIELGGKDYSVKRKTDEPDIILIEGDCSNWPVRPKVDSKTGLNHFKLEEWRIILGELFFNIPVDSDVSKTYPSFRALISYFSRSNVRAYISPFDNFHPLRSWQRQLYCLYLLGLDWQYPLRIHELDKKKDNLNKLQKDLKAIQELSKSAIGTEVISKRSELKVLKRSYNLKYRHTETTLQPSKYMNSIERLKRKQTDSLLLYIDMQMKTLKIKELLPYTKRGLKKKRALGKNL